jgi:hypothetical protein
VETDDDYTDGSLYRIPDKAVHIHTHARAGNGCWPLLGWVTTKENHSQLSVVTAPYTTMHHHCHVVAAAVIADVVVFSSSSSVAYKLSLSINIADTGPTHVVAIFSSIASSCETVAVCRHVPNEKRDRLAGGKLDCIELRGAQSCIRLYTVGLPYRTAIARTSC